MRRLYTLLLATGHTVTGEIHGSGGVVGAGAHNRERICRAIRRANEGRDTGLYQPKPGHARLYLSRDYVETTDVDLRGAEVL